MTQVIERVPFDLNPPQARLWLSDARYVDLEGGVCSGKATVAVLKLLHLLQEHPGLHALAARWTQDATDAQLKPRDRELLGPALLRWHADEEFFDGASIDRATPSRLYVRGLKASEDSARYSKFAGLAALRCVVGENRLDLQRFDDPSGSRSDRYRIRGRERQHRQREAADGQSTDAQQEIATVEVLAPPSPPCLLEG